MKKFIHQLFAILMVLVMLFDAAPVAVLAEGEDTQLGAEVSASAESGNATGEANPVSRGGQLGVEKANYHLLDASEYTVTSVTGSFDRFLDPNYVPGNASQAEDTRGLSEGEDSAASADDQQTQALAPSAVITPKLSKRSTPVLQTKGALGSVQTLNAKGVEAEPANDLSLTSVSDGESSAAPDSPSATVEEPKASDTNAPAVPEPQQVKGLVAYEIELNEGVPFAKEYDYKVKVPVGVNMLKDVKEEPGKIIKINQVNYRLFHLHGETEEEITNVSVTQNDGIISNFTFTTEDFSTFVLVYTVDFVYETIISKVCINFENAKENSDGSEHFQYNNVQTFTEFAVADILADAPALTENWKSLYVVSLHEAAKLTDYDAAFFTSAAVDISSTGIEVSNGAIRLKGDVKEGKVTFTTKENKLEVEIANYVAPPAPQVPEDAEGFAYRFFGKPATLDDILAENSIVSSYNSIVSLSDEKLVAIEKDGSLAAQDYFDAVTLTVALTDGSEVEIILSNPAPVKADETVITAGVGSFAATEAIPAGTKLVVNDKPVVPEGIKIGASAAKDEETEPAKDSNAKGSSDEPTRGVTETKRGADGNEAVKLESSPAFYDISLVGPDGKELETGASVTVSASIPLDKAPEGQKLHVTGVNVYHITETEDGGYQVEQLESTGFALADGVISEVSFTTPGFSLFAITYTYEFIELTGTINLNFTGFVPYPAEGVDATFIYDTDSCDIRVVIDKALGAVAADGVAVENSGLKDFDLENVAAVSSEGGVKLEKGTLIISGNGVIVLSDGEKTLTINITGITELSEEILKAEGVEIKVEEGKVPLGSQAKYTQNTEEKTASLVEEHKLGEGEKNIAGYSSADLKIVRNGEPVNAEGQFSVALAKSSLIPAGMKLDKLYHIHDGKADVLDVTETEDGLGLVFEVENFSDIVASYTVEFYHGDQIVVIPGGSKVLLSTLINGLALTRADGTAIHVDEVKTVEFNTPGLFNVEEVLFGSQVVLKEDEEEVTIETEHDFVITSLSPFDADEMILTLYDGTVIRERVTDSQDTLTTFIKFFAKDAEIIKAGQDPEKPYIHIIGNLEAPDDPALSSTYYVLAVLKDSKGHDLGWAIEPVTLSSETTQVNFSAFNPFEAQNEDENAEVYAARRGQTIAKDNDRLSYDKEASNTIETRLYRADSPLTTVNYLQLVTNHEQNHTYTTPEDGYEFGGNFTNSEGTQNEIHLKKANNKKYKVRIYLDENATDDITETDKYYLYIKVTHQTGEPSYQFVPLTFTASEKKGSYIEYEFPHWMDANGNVKPATANNNTFTGNEQSIEVKLLKFDGDFKPNNYGNATVNEEGSAIKAYKVHYDTRETNAQTTTTTQYHEEEEIVDGKTVINCIDFINLTTIDAEGQYNYASVLGPNLNYGVVADHLFHDNHMQSNFAVNHYTGHGHDARPDLSGTSGGQIVIAEFNTMVSDFWNNGTVNGVGPIATGIPNGQLKIGDPLSGTLVVYADRDSGSTEAVDSQNNGKVAGNLAQTVVIQTEGEELSANIVEPALHYMDNMSAELAAQPATFDPPIPSEGKLTIDTKAFPDDATIFIDADRITKFIGAAGKLIIDKKPDQTIIFNFKEPRSWAADPVQIAQFVVKQDGFPADGYTTHSPVGTGAAENVYMDSIARHVVWNLNGVKGKMEISSASGGIFLQPNENSWIEINGTTAGWIVSEGLVSHPSGEWHNVFAEMPETSSVKLHAYKTVDGKQPRASQKFYFFLDEYDTSVAGNWSRVFTNTMNTVGSIEFPEIKNLTTGWHVYRIHEDQVKPSGTNGFYIMDGDTYYAAVNVQSTTTSGGQAATIVSPPVYYRSFDPATFNPGSAALTGFSNENKVNRATFKNEEVKEGLNILKKVQGTTANDVEFTFKVELWFTGENETEVPYVNGEPETAEFEMNTAEGKSTFTLKASNNETNHSVGYVTLKAGELVNIQGINRDAHYKITETKVENTSIQNGTDYVKGYKRLTEEQTGDLNEGLGNAVFENEYNATGTLELKAHKTLTDLTENGKTLLANSFGFRLGGHNAVDPETWIWNDDQGAVTFPTITYTSADMEDAVPDPDNGSKLTKTLIYTVHENHELGTGATNLAAQNVTYDGDKNITVTLVDNGDGTITATADVTNLPVEFNNTYEYQASQTIEGTKVLTGRDMGAEEFWFNAVLTKYDDGTTETTYASDAQREAAAAFVTTKVQGTNISATAVDGTATGSIVFPQITFKQPGTYTFTVTEDETRLPEDVEPTTPGQSYEVTIVVSQSTASNGDIILVASEPTYTNNKTIENTQKKMSFTVTKDWKDKDEQPVNNGHSITFAVQKDGVAYSVTPDHIEQVMETPGSFTVNDDGTVTLIAGETGWPTVKIKELDYPTTGYTVVETTPAASSENADVKVKYALNAAADQDACPAIKHDKDVVVIKNTEEDNSTSLKVTKQYVLPGGSDGNSTAKKDPIYFAVVLKLGENWTVDYNNTHATAVDGTHKAIYQITWNETTSTWNTVDIGEIPATIQIDSNNVTVLAYWVVETTNTGAEKTTDTTSLLAIKYYTDYGKTSQAEVTEPITQGPGATITIENKIPEPRHLIVTKKWVDENDVELTDLTGKGTIQFILVHKNAYGELTYAQEDGSGNITFGARENATEFTLTGSIVNGKQVWTTKRFDDLQLTPNASDAQNYSRYYLVETVGNGPEVTCVLDDGTTVDETHPYDPNTSGTITIVNKEVDNSIKVKKVWIGDNPQSIEVELLRKGSSEPAYGWEDANGGGAQKFKATLNASNNWYHAWEGLSNDYTYYVKEIDVAGYTTTYSSNNSTGLHLGDTVTITNTKTTTGIAVHKVWDVENDNDIKPVTVQLMKAGESLDDDARKVTVVALNQFAANAVYGKTTYYVKNGTDIVINVGYNFKAVEYNDYTSYNKVGNDITISNVTADGTITVIVGSYQPTVTYTKAVTYNKESGTVVDSVPLSASNNWYKAWTTSTTPAIDGDSYYFVVETAVDGTPLASTAYVPTYTNNDGIKTGLITITNQKNTPQPGSLTITKVIEGVASTDQIFTFEVTFKNADDNTAYVGPVKVQYATGTTPASVTTDSYGKLTVTITGAGSAFITEIPAGTKYTVVEKPVPTGWEQSGTVAITGGNADQTIDSGETETATVTNTKQISIYAKKVWKQGETVMTGWPADVTSVTFQLKEKANGAADTAWDNVTSGEKTVDHNTANYTVHWDNLTPTKDYRVEETAITKTDGTTNVSIFAAGTGYGTSSDPLTVTNEISPTTITVKKTWGGSTWPANIEVEMTLKAGNAVATNLPAHEGNPQTAAVWLTSADATNGKTWYNLPVYTDAGVKIVYTVEETGMRYQPAGGAAIDIAETNWKAAFTTDPSGYIGTPDTYGIVTIDNTPKETSIQVTKVWTLNGTARKDKPSIGFTVHKVVGTTDTTLSPVWTSVGGGTVTQTGAPTVLYQDDTWQTVTISKLPKYELKVETTTEGETTTTTVSYVPINYYVVETDVNAPTVTTYRLNSGAEGEAAAQATNGGTITIINRDASVNIGIVKIDETKRNNTPSTKLPGASFQLYKGTTVTDNEGQQSIRWNAQGEAQTTSSASGSEGTLTFSGLTEGRYKIVETQAPAGYNNLTGAIYFAISVDGAVSWTNEQGQTISAQDLVTYTPASDTDPTTFTVGNNPGVELPATGGPGTLVYTVTGLTLTLGAALWLILSRRKREQN